MFSPFFDNHGSPLILFTLYFVFSLLIIKVQLCPVLNQKLLFLLMSISRVIRSFWAQLPFLKMATTNMSAVVTMSIKPNKYWFVNQ